MAQTPASTRWRLGGKLPDGHVSLTEESTTIREAQRAAASAARDIKRTAAQHDDVTARLRALRSPSSRTPTMQAVPIAGVVASRTSSVPQGDNYIPFRPSPTWQPTSPRGRHQSGAATAGTTTSSL